MNPTTEPQTPATGSDDTVVDPADKSAATATAEKNDAPVTNLDKKQESGPVDGVSNSGADGSADDGGTGGAADGDDDADLGELDGEFAARSSSGLASAAAAVVSVGLSFVALIGSWSGKVISERETLVGQIELGQTGTPEQQISEIYGDAWHSVAFTNGIFAVLALIAALVALGLPQRKGWVRPFAVAGLVLGGIAALVSVGMYFDLFVSLPEPPPAPALPGS